MDWIPNGAGGYTIATASASRKLLVSPQATMLHLSNHLIPGAYGAETIRI